MKRTSNSPAFPLLLMILAPATVVVTLLVLHNVWATFACYHLGICVLVPLLWARLRERRSLADHLSDLGLAGTPSRQAMVVGVLAGVIPGAATVAGLMLWDDVFLGGARVQDALAGWGVPPGGLRPVLIFMLVGNGLCEELLWRGYIQGRFGRPASLAPPGRLGPSARLGRRQQHQPFTGRPQRGETRTRLGPLTIFLIALCYASYHAVTVALLVRVVWVTVLFTLVVLATGCFWGWLRERYGTVWPAVLSHGGATAGYMIVCWVQVGGVGS